MKKSQLKIEDVTGDVKNTNNFNREQKTNLNNFLAKIM